MVFKNSEGSCSTIITGCIHTLCDVQPKVRGISKGGMGCLTPTIGRCWLNGSETGAETTILVQMSLTIFCIIVSAVCFTQCNHK